MKPSTNQADPAFRVDNLLCFAVYAASRAITKAYRPLLEPLGLTYPQYLVLLVLWEKAGCTVKDLSYALQLDSGTLSPLLKRLEAIKLVTRNRSRTDEREVDVGLTAKGLALRQKVALVPERIGCSMGLTAESQRRLRQELSVLTENVSNNLRE